MRGGESSSQGRRSSGVKRVRIRGLGLNLRVRCGGRIWWCAPLCPLPRAPPDIPDKIVFPWKQQVSLQL